MFFFDTSKKIDTSINDNILKQEANKIDKVIETLKESINKEDEDKKENEDDDKDEDDDEDEDEDEDECLNLSLPEASSSIWVINLDNKPVMYIKDIKNKEKVYNNMKKIADRLAFKHSKDFNTYIEYSENKIHVIGMSKFFFLSYETIIARIYATKTYEYTDY